MRRPQDPRQPHGPRYRLCHLRAVRGAARHGDDRTAASRLRRRTAPGLPGDAHRAGSRGGRCGTAPGIPAMAGDRPGSCYQSKRDIEQHVRPGCACMVVRVRVGSPRGSGGVRVGQQRLAARGCTTRRPGSGALAPGLATVAYRRHVPGRGKYSVGKPWRSYFRGGQINRPFVPTTPMWRVPTPENYSFTRLGSALSTGPDRMLICSGEGTTGWRTATAAPWDTRAKNISGHCVHRDTRA